MNRTSNGYTNNELYTSDIEQEAVKTIASSVKEMCLRLISKAGFDKTVTGVVIESPSISNATIKVRTMNADRTIKNGTDMTFKKGDAVWVTIPSGDTGKMYISARR